MTCRALHFLLFATACCWPLAFVLPFAGGAAGRPAWLAVLHSLDAALFFTARPGPTAAEARA